MRTADHLFERKFTGFIGNFKGKISKMQFDPSMAPQKGSNYNLLEIAHYSTHSKGFLTDIPKIIFKNPKS